MERRTAHAGPPRGTNCHPTGEYLHLAWQKDARSAARCAAGVGKTYLGAEEMRRADRLAVEHHIRAANEIWHCAPTFKQASA